jgi:hypothetical protein
MEKKLAALTDEAFYALKAQIDNEALNRRNNFIRVGRLVQFTTTTTNQLKSTEDHRTWP